MVNLLLKVGVPLYRLDFISFVVRVEPFVGKFVSDAKIFFQNL